MSLVLHFILKVSGRWFDQFQISLGQQPVRKPWSPPSYSLFGEVVNGLDTAVKAMGALFNPDPAANGVPPAGDIVLKSVTISES